MFSIARNVCSKTTTCWFSSTQSRKKFLFVEGSAAWLHDCPRHFSPLYFTEQCYDKISVNCKETGILYFDPDNNQYVLVPAPNEKILLNCLNQTVSTDH